MAEKINTEVWIGGKSYKLSGYDDKDYIQKVAAYLNQKIEDCNATGGFSRLPFDTQSILLQLNVADDYFKAKEIADRLETEVKAKDKEIYDIKHELITAQMKAEGVDKTIKEMERALHEEQKKVIKLETELKTRL